MSVVSIDSARRSPHPDQSATCPCGSNWFRLARRPADPDTVPHGAVTLSSDGLRVTGYVGEPQCVECGVPFTPVGGWIWA